MNLYSRVLTEISITYGDHELIFIIGDVISKRNKDKMNEEKQFLLLNAYLDYKGDAFKKALFDAYINADNLITESTNIQGIDPLPYPMIHDILDIFDLYDVLYFIKDVYGIVPPSSLIEKFDPLYESDDRGTRVQTYLKSDYMELAALSLIIKATIGPLCHYAFIKNREILNIHTEYILAHFYRNHRIYNTPPMVKLYGLSERLEKMPTGGEEASAIRVLENQLDRDEMPFYILSILLIQRISIATIVDDSSSENIVTRLYNYVNTRLKPSGDVGRSIRHKTALTDPDGGGDGKESMIESYRIMTDITKGQEVELDWAVSTIDRILTQFPKCYLKYVDIEVVRDAEQFSKAFMYGDIQNSQVDILSFIFKKVINPEAIEHITIESIMALMSVGFAYLWGSGNKQLAILLMARVDRSTQDTLVVNSSVNRSRIPKETKAILDEFYPYRRVINEHLTANPVEETINNLANEIFVSRWITVVSDKYLLEVTNDKNPRNVLPHDLKILLADFITQIEKLAIEEHFETLKNKGV